MATFQDPATHHLLQWLYDIERNYKIIVIGEASPMPTNLRVKYLHSTLQTLKTPPHKIQSHQ